MRDILIESLATADRLADEVANHRVNQPGDADSIPPALPCEEVPPDNTEHVEVNACEDRDNNLEPPIPVPIPGPLSPDQPEMDWGHRDNDVDVAMQMLEEEASTPLYANATQLCLGATYILLSQGKLCGSSDFSMDLLFQVPEFEYDNQSSTKHAAEIV